VQHHPGRIDHATWATGANRRRQRFPRPPRQAAMRDVTAVPSHAARQSSPVRGRGPRRAAARPVTTSRENDPTSDATSAWRSTTSIDGKSRRGSLRASIAESGHRPHGLRRHQGCVRDAVSTYQQIWVGTVWHRSRRVPNTTVQLGSVTLDWKDAPPLSVLARR
jgi:hypothetical protein